MAIWETTNNKTYNALDIEKNVTIVYCKDDDNEKIGYCEFDISFNVVGKTITLVENEQFSKFVLKGDKGIFKLDFKKGIQMESLTIDIMIYSGDVTFNVIGFDDNHKLIIDKNKEISYIKYYLANKIFYQFNFPEIYYDNIELEYKAEKYSFFSIKYKINPEFEDDILSDQAYLIQIDPFSSEEYKTINLSNNRMKKGKSFIVTFYSLNCDFQIKRKDVSKEINFFNGFGQEIILPGTVGYYSKKYEYNIKIKEIDTSNYKNKMCMLYLAGYESSDNESETEIVLVENLNQKITFNKNLKSIRFLYPHPNPQKDLAININIINSAKFNVKLYMNSLTVPFIEDNISKSQVLFISQYEMQRVCEIDTLCNIIAQIECTDNLENSI
jgi:hypothetical protein